jgi:hypothetical protein
VYLVPVDGDIDLIFCVGNEPLTDDGASRVQRYIINATTVYQDEFHCLLQRVSSITLMDGSNEPHFFLPLTKKL